MSSPSTINMTDSSISASEGPPEVVDEVAAEVLAEVAA